MIVSVSFGVTKKPLPLSRTWRSSSGIPAIPAFSSASVTESTSRRRSGPPRAMTRHAESFLVYREPSAADSGAGAYPRSFELNRRREPVGRARGEGVHRYHYLRFRRPHGSRDELRGLDAGLAKDHQRDGGDLTAAEKAEELAVSLYVPCHSYHPYNLVAERVGGYMPVSESCYQYPFGNLAAHLLRETRELSRDRFPRRRIRARRPRASGADVYRYIFAGRLAEAFGGGFRPDSYRRDMETAPGLRPPSTPFRSVRSSSAARSVRTAGKERPL